MNLMLKILLSFITPIFAHTDIQTFESSPVLIQWPDYGQEYEYMVEVYDDYSTKLISHSNWLEINSFEIELDTESLYLWKLYIREKEKSCTDKYQCLNIESGYFYLSLKKNIIKPKEENNEEVPISEPEKIVDKQEEVLGTKVERKEEKIIKETKTEDIKEEITTELITEENSCIYKYNIDKKKFTLEDCNIEIPKILDSTYQEYKDEYIVSSHGEYISSINVYIKTVSCKSFDILNPKTWFKCQEVYIRSDEYKDVKFEHEVYFLDKKIILPSNYSFKDKTFEISSTVKSLPNQILVKGYFSIKHNNWLDQEMHISIPIQFIQKEDQNPGIYSLPFNKIVYVNQWHGCTDYQCPHKGIDFASVKENIYASDNGVVVSKGYDTYSGECNSGGNYLVIKYDSGHHMAYMHLAKSYVNVNQEVKDGDLIALSGNSGSNNCQPLGYHLHFELREERSQSTHIDPVPFIDIDWTLIKTNKSNIYPKRLSGDNPHPNF